MRIKRKQVTFINQNSLFAFFAVLSFLLASNKIILNIGFVKISVLFIALGALTYYFKPKYALYLFVFLLPVISAFPYFSPNGFPYNYMATPIFYLSGILLGSVFRGEKLKFNYDWSLYYLFFLLIIWVSALFVFIRWSNITLSYMAFLKDTPVEPGNTRVSFASIFTILTLFLFSISPYIVVLLKKNKLIGEKIFYFLLSGYSISVLISLYQKYFDHYFLKMKMKSWSKEPDQFSGGFSDFNSFGFFSGILFLLFVIHLIKYIKTNNKQRNSVKPIVFYTVGIISSLMGIFLSGSRAAFIFIISSIILFFLSKSIERKTKIIILVLIIVLSFTASGVLKRRVIQTFEKFKIAMNSDNFIYALDKASNGRIKMFQNSSDILKNFPISGVGTGGFLFYLKNLKFGQDYYEDLPLNHYLLIFDETGFVGLFSFLLFLFIIIKNFKKNSYFILFITIYVALFLNNFFWFPEDIILFWIIVATGYKDSEQKLILNKKKIFTGEFLLFVFILANVFSFSKLHPVNLLSSKNIMYNYGFWNSEKDPAGKQYMWSKAQSGVFITLSKEGFSKKIKIFCGAPLSHLKEKSQRIKIYWKSKLYKEINFRENKSMEFIIKGKPGSRGFLEFRVTPVFNLKQLGLSEESRTLGVQIFMEGENE